MKERIKQIRQYFGLSQSQFAQKIGRTAGCVTKLELGKSRISDETADAICHVFGISKLWLMENEGDMFALGEDKAPVDRNAFGGRIKQVRKERGLTQQQFADRIGFHKNQVCYVEGGKSIPSENYLRKVSTAFEVNFDWILTGEGEENAERLVVDEELIGWLNSHPDEIRLLKMKMK